MDAFKNLRGIDTTPPIFSGISANADSIRPRSTVVDIVGSVSDDFYVAEFEGLVIGRVGAEFVLFEQAPIASLFLPFTLFVVTFDGLEWTVADATTEPQFVGFFNFSALEEGEGGLGGISGVYFDEWIPEGLEALLLFDMSSGKVVTIYDVSGSQAPVFIEAGSTFVPHTRTFDPGTLKITDSLGIPISLDSIKIEESPMPPGDYEIILLVDDFGGNRTSSSTPIKILAP